MSPSCAMEPQNLFLPSNLASTDQPFPIPFSLPVSSAYGSYHSTLNFYTISLFWLLLMSEITHYLPFCAWFIAFNIRTSNFIHKFTSFKLHAVPSRSKKSHIVPFYPSGDANHPFVECIHAVHATHLTVIKSTCDATVLVCK